MRISDWMSDGCSSNLRAGGDDGTGRGVESQDAAVRGDVADGYAAALYLDIAAGLDIAGQVCRTGRADEETAGRVDGAGARDAAVGRDEGEIATRRNEARSEERRVGKEWVSKCRSRWSPDH